MGSKAGTLGDVVRQLQTDRDASIDRRSANYPVACDRRKHVEDEKQGITKCVFEALPPVRRLSSLKTDWDKGETIGAMSALALTAVNFPEDLRDIGAAVDQGKAYIKGVPYEGAYNYKDFQHEFSFFRGTLLERFIDRQKHPKIAEVLLRLDKSLLSSKFGDRLMRLLNAEEEAIKPMTKFNNTTGTSEILKDINGQTRYASIFKGNSFGVITARAMCRTTVIGTGVLALIELPKILEAATKGDNVFEQGENASKQTVKSGIKVASITAGIAYGGAIGSKYGKSIGSLVGMGFGAVLGGIASKKLQETI